MDTLSLAINTHIECVAPHNTALYLTQHWQNWRTVFTHSLSFHPSTAQQLTAEWYHASPHASPQYSTVLNNELVNWRWALYHINTIISVLNVDSEEEEVVNGSVVGLALFFFQGCAPWSCGGVLSIEIFEISDFWGRVDCLVTKNSKFSKFGLFWCGGGLKCPKNRDFRNLGFFGHFWDKRVAQKIEIFSILVWPWPQKWKFWVRALRARGPSGPLVQVLLLTHLSLRISWGHFIPKTSNIRLARMKLVQAPAILVGNFGWNQLLDGRTVFRPYTQFRRSICTSESPRTSIRVSPDFILTRHSSPSFGS